MGGLQATAERTAGQTRYILIESLAGRACTAVNPWPGETARVRQMSDGAILCESGDKSLTCETQPGQTYTIERPSQPLESFEEATLSGAPRDEPRSYQGPAYPGDCSKAWAIHLGRPKT